MVQPSSDNNMMMTFSEFFRMETINNILSNRGFQVAVGVSTAAAALALANHLHQRKKFWKARQAWNSQPEDVVILHQVTEQQFQRISQN